MVTSAGNHRCPPLAAAGHPWGHANGRRATNPCTTLDELCSSSFCRVLTLVCSTEETRAHWKARGCFTCPCVAGNLKDRHGHLGKCEETSSRTSGPFSLASCVGEKKNGPDMTRRHYFLQGYTLKTHAQCLYFTCNYSLVAVT